MERIVEQWCGYEMEEQIEEGEVVKEASPMIQVRSK